jgi:NitT/TauT family transport system substrate-binding protein
MRRSYDSTFCFITSILLLGACSPTAGTPENPVSVTFQSKWFPQAQFVGYYAAGGHPPGVEPSADVPRDEEGHTFFEAEGLDVTILPGGDANPAESVASGNADFGTDWLANMVREVEANDYPLRHIAQIYQRPAFELVGQSSSGITSFDDLRGRTIGVWDFGNEFPAQVCLRAHGLTSTLDDDLPVGQEPDVTTVTYAFDPALVFPDQVEMASAMVYNELDQIVGLGYPLDSLVRLSAAENDCGLLEDFVFTTQEVLDSPSFHDSGLSGREVTTRFLRATLRGWQWAIDQATAVVLDVCGDTCQGSGSRQSPDVHQRWQLDRVAELVQPGQLGEPEVTLGCLDQSAYNETLRLLRDVGFLRQGTGDDLLRPDLLAEAGVDCP